MILNRESFCSIADHSVLSKKTDLTFFRGHAWHRSISIQRLLFLCLGLSVAREWLHTVLQKVKKLSENTPGEWWLRGQREWQGCGLERTPQHGLLHTPSHHTVARTQLGCCRCPRENQVWPQQLISCFYEGNEIHDLLWRANPRFSFVGNHTWGGSARVTFLADVGGASIPSFGTSFFLVPPSLFLRCFSPFLLVPAPPFPPLLALLTCSSKKTLLRLSRPTGKITQIIR